MSNDAHSVPDSHRSWLEKPDEWLAEVIQTGSPEEGQIAMLILRQRWESELKRISRKGIDIGLVDEVVQEVWLAFLGILKEEKVTKVSHLLRRLARWKRIRVIRKQEVERKIEADIPIDVDIDTTEKIIGALEEPIEDQLDMKFAGEIVHQVAFKAKLLSPCQRVLWIFYYGMGYDIPLLTRLTNSTSDSVSSALYSAREEVINFTKSRNYNLFDAGQELKESIWPEPDDPASLVVESFSKCVTPRLTPEELRPLGLSPEEFQNRYAASVMLPRYSPEEIEIGSPYLILTQKMDWDEMQTMFKRLSRRRGLRKTEFLSPEQCLLKLDRIGDHLIVTPDQVFEFLPEPDYWADIEDLSEKTYLAVHSPFMRIRVSFGFFDRDLITSEVRSRWPFLPEDAGL